MNIYKIRFAISVVFSFLSIGVFGALQEPGTSEVTLVCKRTEQVRKAILNALNLEESACDEVTKENLLAITELNLTTRDEKDKILELKPGDLSGLTFLEILDLSGNYLSSLPEDLLSQNPHLKGLNFNNNRLSKPPNLSYSSQLERLYLRDNLLPGLPDFSNNQNIRILDISYNNFENPPDISALSNLEELYFHKEGGKLEDLPDLSRKPKLRVIGTGPGLRGFPVPR